MLGIHLTVPLACWRKGLATTYWESEILPPPSTCYGALLSYIGEVDRGRHVGVRVTAGLLKPDSPKDRPQLNVVVRKAHRMKAYTRETHLIKPGVGPNCTLDYQQIWLNNDLMIWVDSSEEVGSGDTLEQRLIVAFEHPERVDRFGSWSLGESSHLINDAWLIRDGVPPKECSTFLVSPKGRFTLPVWTDQKGFSQTRYTVGNLVSIVEAPDAKFLPQILPLSA